MVSRSPCGVQNGDLGETQTRMLHLRRVAPYSIRPPDRVTIKLVRYYIVYRTENLVTGAYYIGAHETSVLEDGYLGSGKILKRAIKKYGVENFKRVVLAHCSTRERMYVLERLIISRHLGHPDCYNIARGGKGGWAHVNKILSDADRAYRGRKGARKHAQRLAEDLEYRDRWRENFQRRGTEAARGSCKQGMRGKKHSPETKERMSASAAGRWSGDANPAAGKKWISHDEARWSTRVPGAELDRWLAAGWRPGRGFAYKRPEELDLPSVVT